MGDFVLLFINLGFETQSLGSSTLSYKQLHCANGSPQSSCEVMRPSNDKPLERTKGHFFIYTFCVDITSYKRFSLFCGPIMRRFRIGDEINIFRGRKKKHV